MEGASHLAHSNAMSTVGAQRVQHATRGQASQQAAVRASSGASDEQVKACQPSQTSGTQTIAVVQTSQTTQTTDALVAEGDSAANVKQWALQNGRDVETQKTVDMEILAQVFNHMTLVKSLPSRNQSSPWGGWQRAGCVGFSRGGRRCLHREL
eukprot:6175530-Pleurochrysis_carterae.AAC.1